MDYEPCPFCGETEEFELVMGTRDREGTPVNLICAECGASGPWIYSPPGSSERLMEAHAIDMWNDRVEPAQRI